MMPAQAQAIVTGTVLRTPSSSAENRSTELMRVSRLRKLRATTVMIAQNPAIMALKPTASSPISTASGSSRGQPRLSTARKLGSWALGIFCSPYFSASR